MAARTTIVADPPTTDSAPAVPNGQLPRWHPLSGRWRWIKVLALALLLGIGAVHLTMALDAGVVDVSEMMEDPARYAGRQVYVGQFRVVQVAEGSAELWSPWAVVRAWPVPDDLRRGDVASLVGEFQADSSVRAIEWKIQRLMKLKKAIGLLALLLVVVIGAWDVLSPGGRRA